MTTNTEWRVRVRRNADGELLDCFVEQPPREDQAYGLEVLGDDYTGFGDAEEKLRHCNLIVSAVNAATTGEEMVPRSKLDAVYLERNMLACALARMAAAAGLKAGRGIDTSAPPTWDPEWLRVVYVDLPDGQQVSWHMGPGTEEVWSTLPEYTGEWDGTMLGREAEWPNEVDWHAREGSALSTQPAPSGIVHVNAVEDDDQSQLLYVYSERGGIKAGDKLYTAPPEQVAASVAVPDEAIRQALVTHVPRVTDKKVETIIRYIRKLAAAPVAPEREVE